MNFFIHTTIKARTIAVSITSINCKSMLSTIAFSCHDPPKRLKNEPDNEVRYEPECSETSADKGAYGEKYEG